MAGAHRRDASPLQSCAACLLFAIFLMLIRDAAPSTDVSHVVTAVTEAAKFMLPASIPATSQVVASSCKPRDTLVQSFHLGAGHWPMQACKSRIPLPPPPAHVGRRTSSVLRAAFRCRRISSLRGELSFIAFVSVVHVNYFGVVRCLWPGSLTAVASSRSTLKPQQRRTQRRSQPLCDEYWVC